MAWQVEANVLVEHLSMVRPIPVEIANHIKSWRMRSNAWLIGYFIIGVAGILFPALIASGLIASVTATKIIALAAAVISGLQSLLKCDTRANRYHIAWTRLNRAKLQYEQIEETPLSDVIASYGTGEMIIETAFTPIEDIKPNNGTGKRLDGGIAP